MKKIILFFIFTCVLIGFNLKTLINIYIDYKYQNTLNNNSITYEDTSSHKEVAGYQLKMQNKKQTEKNISKKDEDLELLKLIEEVREERRISHTKYLQKNTSRSHYSCDGRKWCSQMHSCEEAKFFSTHCSDTMDGDNDGIPCESQWCRH